MPMCAVLKSNSCELPPPAVSAGDLAAALLQQRPVQLPQVEADEAALLPAAVRPRQIATPLTAPSSRRP